MAYYTNCMILPKLPPQESLQLTAFFSPMNQLCQVGEGSFTHQEIFDRSGVDGAVRQKHLLLINSVIKGKPYHCRSPIFGKRHYQS